MSENEAGKYTAGLQPADTGSATILPADVVAYLSVAAAFSGLRTCRDAASYDAVTAALKTALTSLWASGGNIEGVLTKISRG